MHLWDWDPFRIDVIIIHCRYFGLWRDFWTFFLVTPCNHSDSLVLHGGWYMTNNCVLHIITHLEPRPRHLIRKWVPMLDANIMEKRGLFWDRDRIKRNLHGKGDDMSTWHRAWVPTFIWSDGGGFRTRVSEQGFYTYSASMSGNMQALFRNVIAYYTTLLEFPGKLCIGQRE